MDLRRTDALKQLPLPKTLARHLLEPNNPSDRADRFFTVIGNGYGNRGPSLFSLYPCLHLHLAARQSVIPETMIFLVMLAFLEGRNGSLW